KWTWHVDRGLFDIMLLQHANKLGAAVYEGVRTQSVDFEDPQNPKIKFTMGRQELSLSVRAVVDASGRHTLLGNQLRLKQQDPVFNQYATHAWFDNFNRKAAAKKDTFGDYIFVHFMPLTNSWIWQIPISETVTSIGVVTQRKNFEKTRQERQEFFWHCLE